MFFAHFQVRAVVAAVVMLFSASTYAAEQQAVSPAQKEVVHVKKNNPYDTDESWEAERQRRMDI